MLTKKYSIEHESTLNNRGLLEKTFIIPRAVLSHEFMLWVRSWGSCSVPLKDIVMCSVVDYKLQGY